MATRIAFSTHWPERMGELAGEPTNFPMKIMKGINPELSDLTDIWPGVKGDCEERYEAWNNMSEFALSRLLVKWDCHPKTTTIRKNYEYWKSKEGQLIQPFFWAGKPYRSKHVVFCPEVRLKRVKFIRFLYVEGRNIYIGDNPGEEMPIYVDDVNDPNMVYGENDIMDMAKHEGFDHPDHFWMWFDQDFDGALLEIEKA